MTYDFVIQFDSLNSTAHECEALSFEGDPYNIASPPISSGDFVIIDDEQQQRSWFGQVIEPQRNIPLGLSRDNPSTAVAMERVLNNQVEASVFARQTYYYKIRLLGEVNDDTGRLQSVRLRPRAGSKGRRADQSEVIRYMDLPELYRLEENRNYNNILGRIHGLDIPITIDSARLYQHVLVAGATGAGKSNTVANLVKAAQAYGLCVLVFDHKPDYQNAHEPNDEIHLFNKFHGLGLQEFGLQNVNYYSLYTQDDDMSGPEEVQIAIRACDVSINMLSSAIFYRSGEELQYETINILLRAFAQDAPNLWSLEDFITWAKKVWDQDKFARYFNEQSANDATYNAMMRKITQRKPDWMDSLTANSDVQRHNLLSRSRRENDLNDYFQPSRYFRAGQVNIIRVNVEGREYGLFLSYILQNMYDLRRHGQITYPILNVVDEAQDIFQGSRAMQESATSSINEIVRKGRSKQIGFIFAVQSASQLPDPILNNMNSRFIHRQNTEMELRVAMPNAPRELLYSALSFGAGEALVSILGARGIMHSEMAPSPFMLTKFATSSFQTMADQLGE